MPRALRPGDRVALVAPAGPPPADLCNEAVSTLASWGLEPVLYPGAAMGHPWASYLSAPDEQRAAELTDAWCDESIAGIFCLRGGYGTIRILDSLDRERWRTATPKRVFGSSDITCLLEWLRENLDVASWLAPMLATRVRRDDQPAMDALRGAAFGDHGPSLAGKAAVPGSAAGPLIGGNLSLLAMTLGAKSRAPVDNSGAIVVLEDVAEDTYRIDGYLQALLRSGWFDGVAGVVLGSWLDCSGGASCARKGAVPEIAHARERAVPEIVGLVRETLEHTGVPIGHGFDIGHGPGSATVPLGVSCRLEVDDVARLSFDGAG